jgi:hypothetical protein
MARQPEQQQQNALNPSMPCLGCGKAMPLVGRESHPLKMDIDLLTFECECGQITTTTTGH